MKNNTEVQQQTLKPDSVSRSGVTIMAICGAGPAMCFGGSVGDLINQTGYGLALAVICATILVILIGLSYGSLSEKYNNCGGTYAYISQSIGRKSGLWTAFVYFGVLFATAGAPPTIFCIYFNELTGCPPILGFFVFIIPIVLLSWFGVEVSVRAMVIVWFLQMILLLWPAIKIITLSVSGFDFGQSLSNAFVPSGGFGANPGGTAASGLLLAILTWVWAYVGFEAPAYMGEELKGGAKSVKFAIPMSALCMGIFYAVTCWIWTATASEETMALLAGNSDALAAYTKLVGWAAGSKIVAFAIIASCYASALAFYSLIPRFIYDMGRTGVLPKGLSKINKYQIPSRGVIVYAIIAFFMCMYGSYGDVTTGAFANIFSGITDIFIVMAISASTAYGFICIANVKERWRDTSAGGIFFGKIIPIITVAVLFYMIFFTTGMKYVIFTLGLYAFGLLFAFVRNSTMTKRENAA